MIYALSLNLDEEDAEVIKSLFVTNGTIEYKIIDLMASRIQSITDQDYFICFGEAAYKRFEKLYPKIMDTQIYRVGAVTFMQQNNKLSQEEVENYCQEFHSVIQTLKPKEVPSIITQGDLTVLPEIKESIWYGKLADGKTIALVKENTSDIKADVVMTFQEAESLQSVMKLLQVKEFRLVYRKSTHS